MDQTPTCPRCAYDLSGSTQGWSSACPTEGLCSECGLEFHWGDLLHPDRRIPAWFFEHACERLWRRSLGTMFRSAHPAKFWNDVRIHHPVRIVRVLVLLIVVAALSQVFVGVIAGGLAYLMAEMRAALPRGYPPAQWSDFFTTAALPQVDRRWMGEWRVNSLDASVFLVLVWGFPIVLFLILGDTMRMAKVRWAHLWRVASYSFIPALLLIQGDLLVFWLGDYERTASYRGYSGMGYPHIGTASIRTVWRAGLGAFVIWFGVWWFYAIHRYMRLPRPWLIFLVIHGTAMFGTGVLFLAYKVWPIP